MDRIEYLQNVEKLNKATSAYDVGTPILTDKEWDDIYFKICDYERESGFVTSSSPSQTIYYKTISEQTKVKHEFEPMLSLNKTKNLESFEMFCGGSDTIVSLKLDGVSLRLTYEDGNLKRAETRGDGTYGTDVTYLIPAFQNIPLTIDKKGIYIIDGEAIITYPDFDLIKDEYNFKNPRNTVAGTLGLLDTKEAKKRKMSFYAWRVLKGEESKYFCLRMTNAQYLGFSTVPFYIYTGYDMEEIINSSKELAKRYGLPIDGLVQTFDDMEFGDSLGETEHHPKHSLALKFYNDEYETELLDIEWNIGRSGQLTPVAIFEPVEIEGTAIQKSTLHNISVMEALYPNKWYKGMKLKIIKSNQVIPKIMAVLDNENNEDKVYLEIPDKCPICGEKTGVREDNNSKILVCGNPHCKGKLSQKISHFCEKRGGLDIKGLSSSTIDKLIQLGWLKNLSDIYRLKEYKEEWKKVEGFGDKSVENILEAIEKSKRCKLQNFISAIGIPFVGLSAAKEICKYYSTWDDFKEGVGGEWSEFNGIGEEIENSINNFDFTQADIIAEQMEFVGYKLIPKGEHVLTFCITGKLGEIWKKRKDLDEYIESKGYIATSSITQEVDYLVCNNKMSTSRKAVTAKKLGIPFVTEKELKEILN